MFKAVEDWIVRSLDNLAADMRRHTNRNVVYPGHVVTTLTDGHGTVLMTAIGRK